MNTADAAERDEKAALASKIVDASIRFANEIVASKILKSFDACAIAKAYIQAKLYHKEIEAISKVSDDLIDHWLLYRKAQALLALGDQQEALKTAIKAFNQANSPNRATEDFDLPRSSKSML